MRSAGENDENPGRKKGRNCAQNRPGVAWASFSLLGVDLDLESPVFDAERNVEVIAQAILANLCDEPGTGLEHSLLLVGCTPRVLLVYVDELEGRPATVRAPEHDVSEATEASRVIVNAERYAERGIRCNKSDCV